MKGARRRYLIKGLGLSLPALGLTLLMTLITPIPSLDRKGLDYLFILRGPLAPPGDIVIVAIDEPSFAELGLQWPWPRGLHARLIDKLKEAGARVIGFDILFVEPSDPSEDEALAEAMARAGNVVLASDISIIEEGAFRHTIRLEPIPIFKDSAAGVGLAVIHTDPDAFIRRQLKEAFTPRRLESRKSLLTPKRGPSLSVLKALRRINPRPLISLSHWS